MPTPIDFYFDFSSPYSFLAAEQIDALAARHGRSVEYRPTLLGAVFKVTGGAPLTELAPPKARYSVHDFDQPGHQVEAALQLHVDVGKRLRHLVAIVHQAVEHPHAVGHCPGDQRHDDPEHRRPPR